MTARREPCRARPRYPDALYAFVIDRLTERREVADVRTSVVYKHIRRPVLEPLGTDIRT